MPLDISSRHRPCFLRSGRNLGKRALRFESCEPRWAPALFLDVGTHQLLPNTPNQRIDIFLESTDLVNDPKIELMNLQAEIGDAPHRGGAGFDPYPNFQDVDFSGGIWDEFPNEPNDQTPGATPYHAGGWVVFASSSVKVAPHGKVVTLIVDTTGFNSGTFPLKLKDVGAEFDVSVYTDFGYSQFNSQTNTTDILEAPVTITNGLIQIGAAGAPPAVDLNGTSAGTGFNAYFDQGGDPVAVVGSSGAVAAQITDPDSTHLALATITLQGVQDGTAEILAVNNSGTAINASYNSSNHVLTLTGNDTLANYQQVLHTLTYRNTANPLTAAVRTVSVVVNDGTSNSAPVTANITAYDGSFPWHNAPAPTNVDNMASGTTLNDALIIVSDLRIGGSRQLPLTVPSGNINYVDVDRNNRVTINDALVVVSFLRNLVQGGEGEGESMAAQSLAEGQHASAPPLEADLAEADLLGSKSLASVHDLALLAALAECE